MSMLKYFLLENKLYVLLLLNSSSPVDIVNEGGGEMKSNEEEGDCSMGEGNGIQADEGSVTLKALMQISSINPGKITRMV